MTTYPTTASVPEPIRSAIQGLWRRPTLPEDGALASGAFRLLENNCRSIYQALNGSRLERPTSSVVRPNELRRALQNFFRWNGAPWYEGHVPNIEETSVSLHRTFLCNSVKRVHLVPLDRLFLEEHSSGRSRPVTSVHFGENEIVHLTRQALAQRVPVTALQRFGPRYEFPTDELDGFYWLVATEIEETGPIYRRTWLNFLNMNVSEIGTEELFRPTHPKSAEDALFVLLLTFLKGPREAPWQPFGVPWMFSFTDDVFSDPTLPPDARALSRSIVGNPEDEFEVPDCSESFEMGSKESDSLQERWRQLRDVSARGAPSLHPLSKYFFVKALGERGIDQIISDISCLEATLMLKGEHKGRRELKERYARLVGNDDAGGWINSAYRLRDDYLHSFGDPKKKLTWKDLARVRWAVAKAVDKFLDCSSRHLDLDRTALLKRLSKKPH